MVVFTCNNCGEPLQKPKVAKHLQISFRCRPGFLTCVDCHKDFRGEEYTAHTKCITENERYGAKGFTPKASANKGERKQQEWINLIQNLLNTCPNLTGTERKILNTLARHENVPRKKAKFLNFIRSVFGPRTDMSVIESLWTKMEGSFKEITQNNQSQPTNGSNSKKEEEDQSAENNVLENENNENIDKENEDSTEKTEQSESQTNGNESGKKKKKKSKKRALESTEDQEEEPAAQKRLKTDSKNEAEISAPQEEEENSKFSWKSTIIEIVSTKGEMSLNKLRKKVIARYLEHSNSTNSEKATSKFDKKIKKVSEITINDNKVTLV